MSEPKYKIKLDIQHVRRTFHAYVHASDTPILRAYLYQNEKQWIPPDEWTATLFLGTDFEDSVEGVKVAGTIADGTETPANYVDFDFSAGDVAESGDYFCQIIVQNSDSTKQFVFGDGTVHILPSPISGEYTPTTLKSTVNWDVITNTGTVPWSDSTEVIVVDCSESPITIDSDDQGKTWVVTSACNGDVEFLLPLTTEASNGAVFKFVNQSSYVLTVRSTSPDYIDEIVLGNAIYSGEDDVNDNDPYASIRIKQLAEQNYHCEYGRLKWTYKD